MVDGLAGVRNSLGDAHGATAAGARPSPRHAEQVVNLSRALSNLLMRSLAEKHQAQDGTVSSFMEPGGYQVALTCSTWH